MIAFAAQKACLPPERKEVSMHSSTATTTLTIEDDKFMTMLCNILL
jgi:hypothetical protein